MVRAYLRGLGPPRALRRGRPKNAARHSARPGRRRGERDAVKRERGAVEAARRGGRGRGGEAEGARPKWRGRGGRRGGGRGVRACVYACDEQFRISVFIHGVRMRELSCLPCRAVQGGGSGEMWGRCGGGVGEMWGSPRTSETRSGCTNSSGSIAKCASMSSAGVSACSSKSSRRSMSSRRMSASWRMGTGHGGQRRCEKVRERSSTCRAAPLGQSPWREMWGDVGRCGEMWGDEPPAAGPSPSLGARPRPPGASRQYDASGRPR